MILTIYCVSIVRFCCLVKCNSVTLKGENFSRGERGDRRDFVENLFRTVISFWDVQKIRMFIIRIMRIEIEKACPHKKVLMGFVKW